VKTLRHRIFVLEFDSLIRICVIHSW